MIALTSAIKAAGMKPKLWIAPLAVDPGTDLLHDHTDLLLLNEDGAVQDVTWWNSFYLCPAYPPTVERTQALVRTILGEWGFMGLKIDGQHLNGVAPCYNPAHHHAARRNPARSCRNSGRRSIARPCRSTRQRSWRSVRAAPRMRSTTCRR